MTLLDDESPVVEDAEKKVRVTAHKSSPDRVIFTERNNTDGWIATDQTVSVRR
jgi:hypothetical protein